MILDVDEQSKKAIKDILIQFDRTLLVADPRRCEAKKFGGPVQEQDTRNLIDRRQGRDITSIQKYMLIFQCCIIVICGENKQTTP